MNLHQKKKGERQRGVTLTIEKVRLLCVGRGLDCLKVGTL